MLGSRLVFIRHTILLKAGYPGLLREASHLLVRQFIMKMVENGDKIAITFHDHS